MALESARLAQQQAAVNETKLELGLMHGSLAGVGGGGVGVGVAVEYADPHPDPTPTPTPNPISPQGNLEFDDWMRQSAPPQPETLSAAP